MRETSKTLRLLTEHELGALSGKGIDIGCGDDPVRPDVQPFDIQHGDANDITQFVTDVEGFDYVFSSHCLEHMRDPGHAIEEWWKLLKPGGTMFVIVPDEDLYEQGYWPSLFNNDHKFTFSISKPTSWSPVSRNLSDLAGSLPNADIVSLRVQDDNYDRTYVSPMAWPRALAWFVIRLRYSVIKRIPPSLHRPVYRFSSLLRFPVDQTQGNAVAQNILILTKQKAGSS